MKIEREVFDEAKVIEDYNRVIRSFEDEKPEFPSGLKDDAEIVDNYVFVEKNLYNLGAVKSELQQIQIPIINTSSKIIKILDIYLTGQYGSLIYEGNSKIQSNTKTILDLTFNLIGLPLGLYRDVLTIILNNKQEIQISFNFAIDEKEGRAYYFSENFYDKFNIHLSYYDNSIISNLELIEIYTDLKDLSAELNFEYNMQEDFKLSELLYLHSYNKGEDIPKKLELIDYNTFSAKIENKESFYCVKTSKRKNVIFNNNGIYIIDKDYNVYFQSERKLKYIYINLIHNKINEINISSYPDFINLISFEKGTKKSEIQISIRENYFHKSVMIGTFNFNCLTETETINFALRIKIVIKNNIKLILVTKKIEIDNSIDGAEIDKELLFIVEGNGKALVSIGSKYINHKGFIAEDVEIKNNEKEISDKEKTKYPLTLNIKELIENNLLNKAIPVFITYENGETDKSSFFIEHRLKAVFNKIDPLSGSINKILYPQGESGKIIYQIKTGDRIISFRDCKIITKSAKEKYIINKNETSIEVITKVENEKIVELKIEENGNIIYNLLSPSINSKENYFLNLGLQINTLNDKIIFDAILIQFTVEIIDLKDIKFEVEENESGNKILFISNISKDTDLIVYSINSNSNIFADEKFPIVIPKGIQKYFTISSKEKDVLTFFVNNKNNFEILV